MAGENDAVTLLRYQVDNASVNAAVGANKKVADSLREASRAAITPSGTLTKAVSSEALDYKRLADNAQAAQAAANQLEIASRQAITDGIVTPTYTASTATKTLIRDIGDLSLGIKRMPEPPLSAFGVADAAVGRGGRSAGQRITGAGRALFNAPDIGGVSTPIARGLIAGGAAVDKLGLSLGQVGALAGVAGVGLVAVAVAFDRFNKELEGSKRLLAGALSANAEYYAALADLTSAEVDARITELKRVRPVLEENATGLRSAVDRAFADLQATLGDAGARAAFQSGAFAPLEDAAKEAEAALEANIQTETRLTQARGQGLFAANDLLAAEELLKEERERIAQINAQRDKAFVDAQVQGVQELIAIEQLTYEERQQRVRQIETEQAVIQQQIATGELSIAAADQLRAQYEELTTETERLTSAGVTLADQLEAERINKEALTDQNDQLLDLIDQEVAAREKLFEINQRIADIEAERIADIARITQERDERLLEIGEDNAAARIKIEEDAADRIAKINRDAARATQIAIGERDAYAFKLAQDRQKDALEDERKSYDKRLKELERSLDKQLKSLDKSYQKQIETVNTAAARQLTIQQRLAREQEFIVATSLTSQKFLTEQGMAGMVVATANGWTTMQEIVVTALTNIIGAARGIVGGVGGSLFPPLIGGGTGGGGGGSSQRYVERIVDRRIGAYFNTAY